MKVRTTVAEALWDAFEPAERDRCKAAFMAFLVEDNRTVYDALRRGAKALEEGMGRILLLDHLMERGVLVVDDLGA